MKSVSEIRHAISRCKGVCRGKLPGKDCPLNERKEENFGTLCYDCTFQSSMEWVLNERRV